MATSFASTVALVTVRDAVSGTKRPAAEKRVATSRLPEPLSRTVAATPFPRAKGASARSETPASSTVASEATTMRTPPSSFVPRTV